MDTTSVYDYNYFYTQAKILEKEGTIYSLESSIVHIEAALENLHAIKEISSDKGIESWLKKFQDYEIKIKTAYYKKKIKYLSDKATKQESVYKYEQALILYKDIKALTNKFYRLGNNKVSKEDIRKIQSKINDLECRINHNEQLEIEEVEIIEDQNDEIIENSSLDDIKFNLESPFEKIARENLEKEMLSDKENNLLIANVKKALEAERFFIIGQINTHIENLYRLVDLLAIKVLHVSEFLDVLQILPVKISKLKGSLIISEKKAKYNSVNGAASGLEQQELNQMLNFEIEKTVDLLAKDIQTEGPILKEFISYLDEDVCLEKNKFSRKNLFYRKSRMQYKFKIQPIIVSSNKIGFLEKNIPYAYQHSSASYFVQMQDLSDLLKYIKVKVKSLERICIKRQLIELFIDNKIRLSNGLRLIGISLGIFGFFYLISIIFNNKVLFDALSVLQYALFAGIVIFALMMIHNYRRRKRQQRKW